MSEKTLKTRIQNKRGTTAEWATGTAPNFVPKDGEIVAYTYVHRIKIGDGTTKVSTLPFVDKVRDVTLDGETMVDNDGIVKLEKTVMTNNYIPFWNNTSGAFEDGVTAGGTSGYVLTAQGPSAKPTWKAVKSISSITVTKVQEANLWQLIN